MANSFQYLGETDGAEPVSLWDLGDLGPQAVHVAASFAAIAQQQVLVVVTLPANQASLEARQSSHSLESPHATPVRSPQSHTSTSWAVRQSECLENLFLV